MTLGRWLGAAALASAAAAPLRAQALPAVGQRAPEFTLPAATRDGVGKTPVRLGDFAGRTVVLAFFYKARTKG